MISYFDLFNWKSTFYINGKFIQPPLHSPIKLIEKDFYCGPVRSQSIGLSNDVKIMDFAKHAKHFCIKDRFKIIPLCLFLTYNRLSSMLILHQAAHSTKTKWPVKIEAN